MAFTQEILMTTLLHLRVTVKSKEDNGHENASWIGNVVVDKVGILQIQHILPLPLHCKFKSNAKRQTFQD